MATYYGPWNEDVAPELREPYSYMSYSGSSGWGRPRHPVTELAFFGALLVAALVGVVVLPTTGGGGAWFGAIACLAAAVVFGWGVRIGLARLGWVRRVKQATGMSPFEMNRKHIPPPTSGQPRA